MSKNKNTEPLKTRVNNDVDGQFMNQLLMIIPSDPCYNVLSDIECLCRHFHECVFLYKQGYIKVFLNPSPNFAKVFNESIEKSHKRYILENIGYWSYFFDTFLILTKQDREHLVLVKEENTKHVFELFKEELSPKVVSVKLVDILRYSNNCFTFESTLKNSKTSVQEKSERFNISEVCLKNSTSKESLKCKRKVVIPSSSAYLTDLNCVILPLPREIPMNENYPQQVSEEQNRDERSILLFPNGYSRPVTTDNTPGFANDETNLSIQFGQNSISGEASSLAHNSAIFTGTGNSSYSAHGARYPNYIEFHERQASYARWTHRSPNPNTLSKAGFFYTNDADLVRCFQCGIGLKDFCPEDDPLKEHVKHSGDCPYLVEVIGEERLAEWKRLLQAQDPEYNRRMQWNNRHNVTSVAHTYRHPEYQTREKRIETFVNWPVQMLQRPEQLADAGLYYTGFEDLVRCFACDGGLRRWDPDDDPWTEHCRWFPACPFARETKGDDYIALVQASMNLGNEGEVSEPLGQDLSGAMEQMTIRDPELTAALEEYKVKCLAMGYQITEFNEAVQEIRNRGTIKPSIEEIVDVIEVIQTRKQQDSSRDTTRNETPMEQNQRLKSYVICMKCERNDVNALFLPCTHHRFCMKCAEQESNCPVCGKHIRQKIRTYMV